MEYSQALQGIPADRRDVVNALLSAAFGPSAMKRIEPVAGGASGALLYRVRADEGDFLLRIEGPRSPLRNPHQYVCMRTAADAGVAPPIRSLDPDAGVALMEWVPTRPLHEYPGGAAALAGALGETVRRLHDTEVFPELRDFASVLERLLTMLRGRLFAPGLLDRHATGFERLRAAYPWDGASRVSSHNDPNPHNVLFDGERLWLVDWETAYRNDPFVDIAIVAENFAPTPDLEQLLLTAWFGRRADAVAVARLRVMRVLTRLYYAGLLLVIGSAGASSEPLSDVSAPTERELTELVGNRAIAPVSPELLVTLGKMQLARFLVGLEDPTVSAALDVLR